jgi:hypothetical protein
MLVVSADAECLVTPVVKMRLQPVHADELKLQLAVAGPECLAHRRVAVIDRV